MCTPAYSQATAALWRRVCTPTSMMPAFCAAILIVRKAFRGVYRLTELGREHQSLVRPLVACGPPLALLCDAVLAQHGH